MKLSEHMRLNSLSDDDMAGRLDCSASAVRKWKYGERVPRPAVLAKIAAVTDGQVTANDFMPDLKAVEAAE